LAHYILLAYRANNIPLFLSPENLLFKVKKFEDFESEILDSLSDKRYLKISYEKDFVSEDALKRTISEIYKELEVADFNPKINFESNFPYNFHNEISNWSELNRYIKSEPELAKYVTDYYMEN